MTQVGPTYGGTVAKDGPRTIGGGYLFGVPLGDLGWFQTALMSTASGFLAFFAATFLAIVSILIWNSTAHGKIDFAASYKFVGLPVGLAVLAIVWLYLGSLWIKRKVRRG